MPEVSKIRDVVDSVTGLVKAVPIYQDAIQPVAREFGVGAGLVMRAINIALYNVAERVWGEEQVIEFLSQEIPKKLKDVPPERIVTPDPAIVGPVVHSLFLYGGEPTLRDLFASLLATAMDRDTADDAHPAFVEILRQLSPDEATILTYLVLEAISAVPVITERSLIKATYSRDGRYYTRSESEVTRLCLLGEEAECMHPTRFPVYLNNLSRLGIIEVLSNETTHNGTHPFDVNYKPLEDHPVVIALRANHQRISRVLKEDLENNERCRNVSICNYVHLEVMRLTIMGRIFCRACGIRRARYDNGDQYKAELSK